MCKCMKLKQCNFAPLFSAKTKAEIFDTLLSHVVLQCYPSVCYLCTCISCGFDLISGWMHGHQVCNLNGCCVSNVY